ncbi:hypothetical protein ABZO31_16580 [Streptomyces sp. HUAS MG47]|uniref:hypothetical protein n=1 Tax=Streptomyces solicamelliae TaxID=3231716 RepID=UPI00387841EA
MARSPLTAAGLRPDAPLSAAAAGDVRPEAVRAATVAAADVAAEAAVTTAVTAAAAVVRRAGSA